MERIFAVIAALLGLTAVGTGAFGAHGLKSVFEQTPRFEAIWQTAVAYHMYHALALLAVAWVASRRPGALTLWAGITFTAGVAIFSGSLYALVLSGVTKLGAITPIGGVSLMVGWLLLALAAWRIPADDRRAAA